MCVLSLLCGLPVGDWNTPEAYRIEHHFGKQSTHTQFPVPHTESTSRCLSLVIRVRLQIALKILSLGHYW